mmetsp:Transcript_22357/g.49885  ORF Transcript_22357/g.49885 Transcript_22357/m.49885 type:complete len:472 (-) Transcript_22357:59-1474(-)
MLLQLAVALDLVEVHLPEELLLVAPGDGPLALVLGLLHLREALHLLEAGVAVLHQLRLELFALLLLQHHLVRAVSVDLLEEGAPRELLLLPLVVPLLPLPLLLLVLQADELLLALGLLRHLQLERLVEEQRVLLGLVPLLLLHRRHDRLALQDAGDERLVERLLVRDLRLAPRRLDGHELVGLGPLDAALDHVLDRRLPLLGLLLRPELLHLVGLLVQHRLVRVDPVGLHLELEVQGLLLPRVSLLPHRLLALLALALGVVALDPELVVELVGLPLLGEARGLLVQLEVAVGDRLELHDLRVHRPQVVDARAPLLVELLLDERLALVLALLLQLVGAHGHLVHALRGALLRVHHFLLVGLLLPRELLREPAAAVLQVGLVVRLELGGLRLDALGLDHGMGLVLPEPLLAHLELVHLGRAEVLMELLLRLTLNDSVVGPHVAGDRHGFGCAPEAGGGQRTWAPQTGQGGSPA